MTTKFTPDFHDYTFGVQGLVADLACLRTDCSKTDVVLVAGSRRTPFPAHSSILAARCPSLVPSIRLLRSKQTHNPDIAVRAILELPYLNIPPRTMDAILRYVYTGLIRFSSSNVFSVMSAANALGMIRLSNLAFHHVVNTTDAARALNYLAESLERNLVSPALHVTKFIAQNTAEVLSRDEFCSLPREAVLHIVKQEQLSASESDIWQALVRWSCLRANIPVQSSLKLMNSIELRTLSEHLREFLLPGFVRVLNMDVVTFANEVEPLRVLSDEEVLMKYRFDATAESVSFEYAFPRPRVEFLTRIRQQTASYASSSHPHSRGITERVMVCMPSWTRQSYLEFDIRCKLGRYADLSFFKDEECSEKVSSLHAVMAAHRVASRLAGKDGSLKSLPRLSIPYRRFWFAFYAPGNFPPAWGYAFRVTPSII